MITIESLAFIAGGGEFLPCCFVVPFGLVGLGLLVLWIWVLVDLVQNEPSEGNDKLIWVLVVVLAGWVGALIYYFVRRPERIRKYGR